MVAMPRSYPPIACAPDELHTFDLIVVNTSAGKDSQAMLDVIHGLAVRAGVEERVIAVHADLGRVEWKGAKELACEQATHYGFRFESMKRPQGDLLDHVRERGMWPSSTARYCTSDHKRGQCRKVITKLVRELDLGRPAHVLNCMGFRHEESPARAKKQPHRYDRPASGKGTVRHVWEWCPILYWTVGDVWQRISEAGTRHHWAYDLGMPRFSCCLCIFAPKPALMLAGKHNPELLDEYVDVEADTGHDFRKGFRIAEVKAALQEQHELEPVEDWVM